MTLREAILSNEDCFHSTVLCFRNKEDIGSRKFKQDFLGYVIKDLTDEEVDKLIMEKTVDNVTGSEYKVMLLMEES